MGRASFAILHFVWQYFPYSRFSLDDRSRTNDRDRRQRAAHRSRTSGKRCLAPAVPSSHSAKAIATTSVRQNALPASNMSASTLFFHDEAGFYDEDSAGKPVYNFSYVNQIYDGLLEITSPVYRAQLHPKSWPPIRTRSMPSVQTERFPAEDWESGTARREFTRHLVERYGVDEVAQWYFEVWNEPNIDFWAGDPKEATYYELYDRARARSSV